MSVDDSRREWAEKWALKVLEQAKLEASARSARSSACAELISLGKRPTIRCYKVTH